MVGSDVGGIFAAIYNTIPEFCTASEIAHMADKSPSKALSVVARIELICDFIENPAIRGAVEQAVPVTMPPEVGALGFDIPLWVGLGTVGLWAALDGFSERAGLSKRKCPICRHHCMPYRFAIAGAPNNDGLNELDDIRHLYAHNYAGEADEEYFSHTGRHVLKSCGSVQLTCGATFDGNQLNLNLTHLRNYARLVKRVLEHFHS
jgi:hypothetical protein